VALAFLAGFFRQLTILLTTEENKNPSDIAKHFGDEKLRQEFWKSAMDLSNEFYDEEFFKTERKECIAGAESGSPLVTNSYVASILSNLAKTLIFQFFDVVCNQQGSFYRGEVYHTLTVC
jgi:hypothetical protein